MPRQDAINFIRAVRTDPALRKGAYACEDGRAFERYLEDAGYPFVQNEFEDALTGLLFAASDEEEASELKEIRAWYQFMRAIT